MPVESPEELERLLAEREIRYSLHFEKDVLQDRPNVTRELVEDFLVEKTDLIEAWEHQPDELEGEKYAILFDKSTRYWLKVVVSDRGEFLNVVTAYLINKEKKRSVEDMI